jgi:transaldolase
MDGRVSIEVDPRIARDTGRTVAEARALWWLVDRPNLFIKIPAAKQGLPAITACLAEGISINVTLIFSLARYGEVIEAFLAGMEQARTAGRDLSGLASVASFFVSRVDTEVDRRLDKIGTEQAAAVRGQAALANARLAYQRYEQSVATERWRALAVLENLAALGIDYGDVVHTLEDQGVAAFDASWDHLGQRLATVLGAPEE